MPVAFGGPTGFHSSETGAYTHLLSVATSHCMFLNNYIESINNLAKDSLSPHLSTVYNILLTCLTASLKISCPLLTEG